MFSDGNNHDKKHFMNPDKFELFWWHGNGMGYCKKKKHCEYSIFFFNVILFCGHIFFLIKSTVINIPKYHNYLCIVQVCSINLCHIFIFHIRPTCEFMSIFFSHQIHCSEAWYHKTIALWVKFVVCSASYREVHHEGHGGQHLKVKVKLNMHSSMISLAFLHSFTPLRKDTY